MTIGAITLALIVVFALMITVFIYAVSIYEKAVEIAPLKEKKERLLEEIASAQNKLSDLKAEMQSKYAELANANRTIAQAKDAQEWLDNHCDTIAAMKNSIAISQQELRHVTDELNKRQEELKQQNLELQKLTGSVQQLSLDSQRLSGEIAAKSQNVDELKQKISQFTAQEAELRKDLDLLSEKRLNVDRELQKAQDENEYLRNSIAQMKGELKNLTDELELKKIEKEELFRDLQSNRSENQSLHRSNSELETANQQLGKDITEKQEKIEKLKSLEAAKRKELDELHEQCNEKQRALCGLAEDERKWQKITHDLEEKKKQIKNMDMDIIAKETEIDQLTKILRGIESKAASGKHQWEDLNREVPFVHKGNTQNRDSEQDWLAEFKDKLKTNGIFFDDRMINAFHTGLKVADYSPLVVLAGISGTGKSLLPRLYAHAMGMNFLQVAVQPRWDGPQDMFGFYNYMEGRYKATELSRFLWQFDCYNNPEAEEKYKFNPPMNLVLLDEMNLARVEYYFSDLLSKLEVRRGLNASDDNQRLNAEIEIECGASEQNSATRRLFVGPNFLFVGTMNEDETTQTLSDKVVDRSNVLRFGRPQKLNATPDIQKFLEAFPERVIFEQRWQNEWIRNENTQRIARLQKVMDEINSQLALLGRPFAHRVWQAMKSYVSNYPVDGEAGFSAAVSDQIEMKILPKLNGLEKSTPAMQDTLNIIKDKIGELKDQSLFEALESVSQSNEPFFQWHGVMR